MANREITYYSLLSSENLRHIEQMADTMDEQSFVTLGFDEKWFHHLWIGANNEAFLEGISHLTKLNTLGRKLSEQLKLYTRKKGEGYEQGKGDFHGTYKARKDWLNHTIFICRNQYNKTRNEIFNEVVKWCVDWQNEWLETFNPYNPTELKEMSKDLKTPLWEQFNKDQPEQKETALSEKVKKHFGFFNRNCPRKHKQILNDIDFEKLIGWTIWYFENDLKVPEISDPIKVVNTNKTYIQLAFKYLFKELHKSSPYPKTLFELYQCAFNQYSKDRRRNFEAVQNNDEVKKLMLIEY
tara:strand:+ start:642 stop:1529 length:888 start_codon:yes stop_codon:yes gene_type:complete